MILVGRLYFLCRVIMMLVILKMRLIVGLCSWCVVVFVWLIIVGELLILCFLMVVKLSVWVYCVV